MRSRTTRTYFAIPDHYWIGDEFATLDDALVAAGDRIEEIRTKNAEHGSLVPEKVWIDQRIVDDRGDRPVRRYTVESSPIVWADDAAAAVTA